MINDKEITAHHWEAILNALRVSKSKIDPMIYLEIMSFLEILEGAQSDHGYINGDHLASILALNQKLVSRITQTSARIENLIGELDSIDRELTKDFLT